MRFPQQYGRIISLGATLAAGVLFMTTALRPQPVPPVGPVWEFSSVTYAGGTTWTCYAAATGCRQEKASDSRQPAEGMMTAAAKLGEKGWELASAGDVSGNNVLYFKRLKSVLNRSETSGSR